MIAVSQESSFYLRGKLFTVRVTCRGQIEETPGAPGEGTILPFGELAGLTLRVIDRADMPGVKTTETVARFIWDHLTASIAKRPEGVRLHRIEVWGNPGSVATVEADPMATFLRDLQGELRFEPGDGPHIGLGQISLLEGLL